MTAAEIGGGFGGKTVVYLEPLSLALSRKSGKPVKMVMSRTEVFRATGPTSSSSMRDWRVVAFPRNPTEALLANLSLGKQSAPKELASGVNRSR